MGPRGLSNRKMAPRDESQLAESSRIAYNPSGNMGPYVVSKVPSAKARSDSGDNLPGRASEPVATPNRTEAGPPKVSHRLAFAKEPDIEQIIGQSAHVA